MKKRKKFTTAYAAVNFINSKVDFCQKTGNIVSFSMFFYRYLGTEMV